MKAPLKQFWLKPCWLKTKLLACVGRALVCGLEPTRRQLPKVPRTCLAPPRPT